jgi:glycosyltransferase involved in cell wall biosynthesis
VILHVLNSSGVAGVESLVLPALPSLGLPVRALFLDERRRELAAERPLAFAAQQGVATERIAVRSRWDRLAIGALAARIHELGPAIVHAHDVKASTYTLAAARLLPEPPALVSTHHGVAGRPNTLAHLYEAFYARFVLPRYDRVLCCSRADEQNLLARGVARDRLVLHWNGVDGIHVGPAERSEALHDVRRFWGVREDGLILGVVGRLSREKRHDRMLAVAVELARLLPDLDWRVLCFGTGPLFERLFKKTADLSLDERVRWMGFRGGIGREMAGFDLLLSLSDGEGMPLNVIEAGWAATPVLATAVGGIVDLLGVPPAGRLVAPSDSPQAIARHVATLFADCALRAELGRRLQERVLAGFTRAAWIERLRAIYSPLLEARGMHGFITREGAMEKVSPGGSVR